MRTCGIGLVLLAVAGLVACSEDESDKGGAGADAAAMSPSGKDGAAADGAADLPASTPAVDAAAGADRGADAAGGSPDMLAAGDAAGAVGPEPFAGKWDYQSGQAKLDCPGAQPLMQDLVGTFLEFRIGAGVSPLILASPGCSLRFDIQGRTAVVQPGQTCNNQIAGRTASSAPTAFTFALEGEGLALARQSSSWTVTFAATPATPCTLTAQGMLTRQPPAAP